MKKLALSAIAVMAVVTSALAFTTNPTILLCDDPQIEGLLCDVPRQFVTFNSEEGAEIPGLVCARPGEEDCSDDPVFETE